MNEEQVKEEYGDIIFEGHTNVNYEIHIPNLDSNYYGIYRFSWCEDAFYTYNGGNQQQFIKIIRNDIGGIQIDLETPEIFITDLYEKLLESDENTIERVSKHVVNEVFNKVPFPYKNEVSYPEIGMWNFEVTRRDGNIKFNPRRVYFYNSYDDEVGATVFPITELISYDNIVEMFENREDDVIVQDLSYQTRCYEKYVEHQNITEPDYERVGFLAEQVLRQHKRENVSINIAFRTIELLIKYPEVEIENEEGASYKIDNLVISIPFNLEVKAFNGLYGTRLSYYQEDIVGWNRSCCDSAHCTGCSEYDDDNYIESVDVYSHSHLNANNSAGIVTQFCLGNTPLSLMAKKWQYPNDNFPLLALLYIVDEYVIVESLEGGPHIKMEDIGVAQGIDTISKDTGDVNVNRLLDIYLANYDNFPLISNGYDILALDVVKFTEEVNRLAEKKLLPDTSYGISNTQGGISFRNRIFTLPDEVHDVIVESMGSTHFRGEFKTATFTTDGEEASRIDENASKFTVWKEIIEKVQKRLNIILQKKELNEYIKEQYQEGS